MRTHLNLIIFAKAPQMGIVKRRLAKDIGHIKATSWYKSQVANLIKRLNRKLPVRKYLFITPKNSKRFFKSRIFSPIATPTLGESVKTEKTPKGRF